MGYAVPGYALGSLLLLFLSVSLDLLPMGGLVSDGFDQLTIWEKLKDLMAHTLQPLCCYLIGGFAFVTMLMKNHLMDNFRQIMSERRWLRAFPLKMQSAIMP